MVIVIWIYQQNVYVTIMRMVYTVTNVMMVIHLKTVKTRVYDVCANGNYTYLGNNTYTCDCYDNYSGVNCDISVCDYANPCSNDELCSSLIIILYTVMSLIPLLLLNLVWGLLMIHMQVTLM